MSAPTRGNYDHHALQQEGSHYDETRDTVVVGAEDQAQAEGLVNA